MNDLPIRRVLLVLLWVLMLGGMSSCRTSLNNGDGHSGTERPNILLIYSDDQRFDTIAALGNPDIITPNLDALVKSGTTFTRAHIMGGYHGALCAPSRAMLMTGRQMFGLFETGDVIPEDHSMMPSVFADAGYRTFGTGKWHNNRDAFGRAFQEGENIFFGGMHMPEKGGHESPWLNPYDPTGLFPEDEAVQTHEFSSTLFADATVRFLERQKESTDPFFAYIAFSSPHDPRTPPPPYDTWYDPENITLPPNFLTEHPFDNGEMRVRDENLLPHPRIEREVRKELASYYGMISEMDAQIGRLVDALKMNGQYENTIIVFAGDNGLAVGSHGLLGKQNVYDHSVRVPMIFSGPGVPAGRRLEPFVYIFDIFPTLAELAGIQQPSTIQGVSMVPAMFNDTVDPRKIVFYAYRDLQRGVRTDDNWKLIRYNVFGSSRTQLFDLNADPYETTDLSEIPSFRSKRTELEGILVEQSRFYGDRQDITQPFWGKKRPTETDHLAKRAAVQIEGAFSDRYPGLGAAGLVDGILCTEDTGEKCWHGMEGSNLDMLIDLGTSKTIHSVTGRFLRNLGSWIFLPTEIAIQLSQDGINYTDVPTLHLDSPTQTEATEIVPLEISIPPAPARFIRFRAKNQGTCPPWHRGAGGKAWLFVDEVVVR